MKTAAMYQADQETRAQASRTRELYLRRGEILLAGMAAPDFQVRGALQAELARVDEQLRALGENP